MREDMDKLIVERARPGSRKATTKSGKGYDRRAYGKYAELEDMPQRESMTRRYGWNRKELNENLNPLKRFLEKSVGRPWDKVYSEIRKGINPKSTVQAHILQHVFDFVEKDTFVGPDGKPWARAHYFGQKEQPVRHGYKELYIHPTNGLLCRTKIENWQERHARMFGKRQEKEHELYRVGSEYFRKIKGIWYKLEMREVPPQPVARLVETAQYGKIKVPTEIGNTMDAWFRTSLFYLLTYEKSSMKAAYGTTDIYCVAGKQASKKDLRRADLRNDKEDV